MNKELNNKHKNLSIIDNSLFFKDDIMHRKTLEQNEQSVIREQELLAREKTLENKEKDLANRENELTSKWQELYQEREYIKNESLTKALRTYGINDNISADEVVRTAYIDTLTGCRSRAYFTNSVCNTIGQNDNVHLVFLDIDNLKYINDNFGHQVGDNAIIKLVDAVNSSIKSLKLENNAILSRMGGDEFVLTMLNTDHNSIINTIETVRKTIDEQTSSDNLLVSFTCGIAKKTPNEDPWVLYDRSDKYNLLGKSQGKDCICYEGKILDSSSSDFLSIEAFNKDGYKHIYNSRGKNNYFIVCNIDLDISLLDERDNYKPNIYIIKQINKLIARNIPQNSSIYRIGESQFGIIINNPHPDYFKTLSLSLPYIIKEKYPSIADKISFSIGGQEILNQLSPHEVVKKAVNHANNAKSSEDGFIVF